MKILLVDDSAADRSLIKRLIADIDVAIEVYECGDGAAAFETYAAQLPDWVLMDVYTKKTDGFTKIKMIRKTYTQAKIIAVTNRTDKLMRKEAEDAGAFALIGKDDLTSLLPLLITIFPLLKNENGVN